MNRCKVVLFLILLIVWCSVYGQTHIYNRYATHSNLEVAYLKGFPLDSTTHVNVTIVRAKNNRAWRWMQKEFNIPPLSKRDKNIIKIRKTMSIICGRDKHNLRYFNKNNIDDNYAVSISYTTQTVIIYHCTNHKERLAIFGYEHNQLLK